MNIRRKTITGTLFAGISVSLLTGCGAEKPANTVEEFLTSFQKGDFEKAGGYIDNGFEDLKSEEDSVDIESLLNAIAEDYKFEKPVEVSAKDDKAEVEVKITSVDVGAATTASISEVMPLAFANAFSEQTEKSEKAFEDLMEKTLVKHITAENAPTATRTVKLNLEKTKDEEYQIVSDESLEEAILANVGSVEDMFSEEDPIGEETEQSEQTSEVISVIAKNQNYDVNPIKVNVEEISFKKASNVPADEQERMATYTDEGVGEEFNYLYVKYKAENTSDEDFSFSGINEIVLFADGKQEKIEVVNDWKDFIDYDEGEDGDYYGKVSKEGEVGVVINTDPSKVNKVRVVIGHSMKTETYDGGTDEQIVEFNINQ